MAVGQVSFHDDRKVKKVLVKQRENPIINRLNKTKVEKHPDLKQEKDDRLRELRKRDTSAQQARVCISISTMTKAKGTCRQIVLTISQQKKEEARLKKEREELKRQKEHAYDFLNDEESMAATSNQDRDEDWEDDFM